MQIRCVAGEQSEREDNEEGARELTDVGFVLREACRSDNGCPVMPGRGSIVGAWRRPVMSRPQ